MSKLSEKIVELRNSGMSYNDICKTLSCSISSVNYNVKKYCTNIYRLKHGPKAIYSNKQLYHKYYYFFKNKDYKIVNLSTDKVVRKIKRKLDKFLYDGVPTVKYTFTFEDLMKKLNNNPICYLSGKSINLDDTSSYQFDHIIPRSRGGDNSLDNLGLCSSEINMAKRNMTSEEFISMCKTVAEYNK